MIPPELPVLLLIAAALALGGDQHMQAKRRAQSFARQVSVAHGPEQRGTLAQASELVARMLSPRLLDGEMRRIARAGLHLHPEALVLIRVGCTAALGCLLPIAASAFEERGAGWISIAGAAAGFALSDWWVTTLGRRRAASLRREWPGLLSRLRLCLAAGMSIEASLESLATLTRRHQGVLAEDLASVVARIRAGVGVDRALRLWADAAGVGEIGVLAGAVERSRMTGVALGESVAGQHKAARNRQRQAYLAWLNALPSRLSVVAMIFFLPAVLIVVLMPSVISFLRAGW